MSMRSGTLCCPLIGPNSMYPPSGRVRMPCRHADSQPAVTAAGTPRDHLHPLCCGVPAGTCSSVSGMVSLTISPEVTLVDEPVTIQASGLPPDELLTIRAWLRDEKGQLFHSRAFYRSSNDGKVDLDQTPATGGDFHGVHPMGLFWSLKPVTPYLRLLKRDVMGSPYYVHVEIYRGLQFQNVPEEPPVASQMIQRWYVRPGVRRVQIREGRVRGALFLPPGDGPFRGVIDMFGGVGGLLEFRSSLLASRGFASLALAYFAYEDLPASLGHVDLKYFEEAAELLRNHPQVSGDAVGVIAICKGAELALAMACFLPQVTATICINGTNGVNAHSMSYGDLYIPAMPFHADRFTLTSSGTLSLARSLEDPRKPEFQGSILPVEKARGAILFLVGDKDQNYDSLFYAKEALARAQKYGKKDLYVKNFPGAGHLLEPPGSPLCSVSQSPFFPLPLTWGGELIPHCSAQESAWRMTLDFLRNHIPCTRPNKL